MIANHSDLPAKPARAAAGRGVSTCYVEAPALPDVLHEQISYLLGHANHKSDGCPECLRLGEVTRLLMRPFD